MSRPLDRAALLAAGFTQEPAPDMVLLRAERRPGPESLTEHGLVRVRYRTRDGGWCYDCVPVEAIVG